MLRMVARRMFITEVADGQDNVLFAVSLPSGSVVHGVRARVNYVCASKSSGANEFGMDESGAISMEGYVLPILDPDASDNPQTLWDQLVPKDTDVDVIDLDTVAADTTAFWEPGEIALAEMFDIGLQPKRLFHHHRVLSVANGSVMTGQDNQTPFERKWTPGGSITVNLRRKFRVRQPSVLVFAGGVPLIDDTSSTYPLLATEAQWPQLKYMRNTLERAILHQMGVFEVGAETPWEEASALLRQHLNPDVFEATGGMWFTQGEYIFAGEASVDHSVTGDLHIGKVDAGAP